MTNYSEGLNTPSEPFPCPRHGDNCDLYQTDDDMSLVILDENGNLIYVCPEDDEEYRVDPGEVGYYSAWRR